MLFLAKPQRLGENRTRGVSFEIRHANLCSMAALRFFLSFKVVSLNRPIIKADFMNKFLLLTIKVVLKDVNFSRIFETNGDTGNDGSRN